jgi:hypothetical protein
MTNWTQCRWKVALIETDTKTLPTRIDVRLKCVVRIVRIWAGYPNEDQARLRAMHVEKLARQLNDPLGYACIFNDPSRREGLNLGES